MRWRDNAHNDEPGDSLGRPYCLFFVLVALLLSGAPTGVTRVARCQTLATHKR